tara:strand:- start:180 stop:308 length:129 start_codon:yes stop_codon:yes gene_type:complete
VNLHEFFLVYREKRDKIIIIRIGNMSKETSRVDWLGGKKAII